MNPPIYHAVQRSNGSAPFTEVVLKSVIQEEDEDVAKALEDEIKSLQTLDHKNVVRVLGYTQGCAPGAQSEHYMLLLPLCDLDLGRFIATKAIPSSQWASEPGFLQQLKLAQQVARGLIYIHKEGLHHLDLKPANVLLTAAGLPDQYTAQIADFGPQYNPEKDQERMFGTYEYMSPECLRRTHGNPGAPSDVFRCALAQCLAACTSPLS